MDYVDFYYSNVLGYTPDNPQQLRHTENAVAYFIDCGFSQGEIVDILLSCPKTEGLLPKDFPDKLWENSLTKKKQFYYHHTLQIASRPPHYDIKLKKEVIEPYFLEMKARYTMNDLIRYYYNKLDIDAELADERRDIGRMQALLKKYDRLSFVDALDFVLCLIDHASYTYQRVMGIFDIEKGESEVFDELKSKAAEASFKGKNLIVWRK